MNSIELTDVDGDALTVITRDHSTWITCTSGRDEVTVGPFPARLVRRAFTSAINTEHQVTATLVGRSTPTRSTAADQAARARAWAAFVRSAETTSLRGALDSALEAARIGGPGAGRSGEAEVLAEDLRHAALTDPDALADHLVSLGYRKA